MARMIGAIPKGVMIVAEGRGIIIITGPPCQSRSGNLWVGVGWGSHLVPKICPGLQTGTACVMMRRGGTMELSEQPHLSARMCQGSDTARPRECESTSRL